ncbi:MAG: hypothetical protein ABIS36_10790 [Chryseolinea sp.]
MESINLKHFFGLQLDQLQLLILHDYHFVHVTHGFSDPDVEKLMEQESEGTVISYQDIEARIKNIHVERKVDDNNSLIGFDLVRIN